MKLYYLSTAIRPVFCVAISFLLFCPSAIFAQTIQDTLPIVINCIEEDLNSITFGWNPTTGIEYEVNVDQQGWGPANGFGAHSVKDLNQNQTVLLEIRGIKDSIYQIGEVSCKTDETNDAANCMPPDVTVANIAPVNCYGNGSSGAVELFTNNFDVIFLIKSDTFFDPFFPDLEADIHSIVAIDTVSNCSTNLEVEINSVDPILLEIATTKTVCGADNATATVTARGGSEPYNIYWSTGDTGATIENLGAGTHEVFVEDQMGCFVDQLITIEEDSSTLTKGLNIVCKEIMPSTITFAWSPIEGLTFYEVKIGNRKWREPTATNRITIPNTNPATQIKVRGTLGCITVLDSITSCAPINCLPPSAEFDVFNGSCNNYKDGVIAIHNQNPNIVYLLNQDTFYNSYFDGLSPGKYAITLLDTLVGCDTIIEAELINPPALEIETYTKSETCGSKDGIAAVTVSGGVKPYSISWDGQFTDTIKNLSAGDYAAFIIDSLECVVYRTLPVGLNIGNAKNIKIDIQCVASTSNSIKIAWDNIPEIVDYEIRVYEEPWEVIGNVQSYELTNLIASNFYGIEVKGISSCGEEIIGSQLCRTLGCNSPIVEINQSHNTNCLTGEQSGDITISLNTSGAPILDTINFCLIENDGRNDVDFHCEEVHTFTPPLAGYILFDSDTFKLTEKDPIVNFKELPPNFYVVEIADTTFSCMDYVFIDILETVNDLEISQVSTGLVSCPNSNDAIVQIIANGGALPYTYSWNGEVQNSETYLNVKPGTYNLIVTDASGCTVSGEYVIDAAAPVVQEMYQKDDGCEEISSGVAGVHINSTYDQYTTTWNTGQKTDTISNLEAGNYIATIQTELGCQDTVSLSINTSSNFDIDITYDTQNASCTNTSDGSSEATIIGATTSYAYEWSTGATTSFVDNLSTGAYFLTITDLEGCEKIDTIQILEPDAITIQVTRSESVIQAGNTVSLQTEVLNGQGSLNYTWSSNKDLTSLSCLNCSNPEVKPFVDEEYSVTVTDEKGCEATTTFEVSVNRDQSIYVPSAFSPNGDGINDLLMVYGKEDTKVLYFRIFNRWGEKVFEQDNFTSNDTSAGWNGKYRGQILDAGVFSWMAAIEYADGNKELATGYSSLIR